MKKRTLLKRLKKIGPLRLMFLIVLVASNSFAWFIYATKIDSTVDVHVRAWNVVFEADDNEITNVINFPVDSIYPGMPDFEYEITAYNKGGSYEKTTMKNRAETPFSISKRIDDLIQSTGLTVNQFSQITGIPYSSLETWINSETNIKSDSIRRFCCAMRIHESWFFKETLTDLDLFRAATGFFAYWMSDVERKNMLKYMHITVSGRPACM